MSDPTQNKPTGCVISETLSSANLLA